jgi:hypothetical protein
MQPLAQLQTKDPSLRDLVLRIVRDAEIASLGLVDHWDADPYAIGLVSASKKTVLLYLSTLDGAISYQLEELSDGDPRVQGDVIDEKKHASYEDVLELVRHVLT